MPMSAIERRTLHATMKYFKCDRYSGNSYSVRVPSSHVSGLRLRPVPECHGSSDWRQRTNESPLKISMKTYRAWLQFKLEVISLCGCIDMLIEIREDLAGSATMIRHQKVPTPKVMITIGISPRMMKMMMMMRKRRLIRF